MLQKINELEYKALIKSLNEEGLHTGLKEDFSKRKTHDGFIFLKMVSEDGSQTLQGFISAEIYRVKRGLVAMISSPFVAPAFYGNNYGSILIYHLLKSINQWHERVYLAFSNANSKTLNDFLSNDFKYNGETDVKKAENVNFRGIVRLNKEL